MLDVVRLLELQAERCLKLAQQCKTKNAERILRMLAVDLALAVEEHQRADLVTQFAELRRSAQQALQKALA